MTLYEIASRTVSPNAFFWMVMDALTNRKGLSCVRMADGEKAILLQAMQQQSYEPLQCPFAEIPGWIENMGLGGIVAGEMFYRLDHAARSCTHFAPSVSGLSKMDYNLYDLWKPRDFYIDNFFVDQWSVAQKEELFRTAGHVLFIHRNAGTADSMQIRVQANLGVKVSFIRLDHWRECDTVIGLAAENRAPLVLFSGGPAGKYIAPKIVEKSPLPKVVIDVGHGADYFTFSHLPMNRKAAEAFHAEWEQNQLQSA